MSDETAFLRAIESAPDDEAPHKVYADWLDEHDRPEEADWHRAWTTAAAKAARRWFRDFASRHEKSYEDGGTTYTAAEIIEAGRDFLERGEYHTQFGMSLQDYMSSDDDRARFWQNWALATGTYVPAETAETGYVFSCTC